MAVTLHETWKSRKVRYGISGGGEILEFIALGSTDQVEVVAAVVAGTPPTWDGFIREDIRPTPMGGPSWLVEVEYGTRGLSGGGGPTGVTPTTPTAPGGDGGGPGENGDVPLGAGYSIDITADQVHITQSIRTLARILPGDAEEVGNDLVAVGAGGGAVNPSPVVVIAGHEGQTVFITGGLGWTPGSYTIVSVDVGANLWILDRQPAPPGSTGGVFQMLPQADDMKGAIGVVGTDSTSRVEGCDVYGPKFDWSRAVGRDVVTRNYVRTLRSLVGKKNNATFYGSPAGEVLYLGAAGGNAEGNRWSLTHRFSEIENRTNIVVIPGELVIPFKRGWDYVWFKYKKELPPGADQFVSRPIAAYVEEVVEDGDFSLIQIGH